MADEIGYADTGAAPTQSGASTTGASTTGASTTGASSSIGGKSGTDIRGAASEVAKTAKASVTTVADEAASTLGSMAADGKDSAAGAIEGVAEALHKSAENFQGQQDWIAGLIDKGSSELGALANTLRSNDLQGLLGKLDDLARREPAVFVGAAMAAGFAAVRLGKVVVAETSADDLPKVELPKVKEAAE